MKHGSDYMIQRKKDTAEYLGVCMFYAYYNNEGVNSGHWNDNSIKKQSVYSSFQFLPDTPKYTENLINYHLLEDESDII